MKISQLFFLTSSLSLCAGLHAKTDRYRVVWETDPATTAVIGWNQANGKDPVLYYDHVDRGEDLDKYSHRLEPGRREEYLGMDSHFVTLSNLKPDTPCYFVIADSNSTSRRFWFHTAPDTPKSFAFIGGGDTKSDPEGRSRGRRSNAMVSKLRPLFVFYAGDFTSNGLKDDEWRNWLDDWSNDTTSEDGRVYPIVPVRGNHETHPDILYRLFGLSDPNNYFAFNIGGDLLRLYALNSQIHVTGEPSSRRLAEGDNPLETPGLQAQTDWLIDDLKNHPGSKFKIASYHKPLRPHTSSKPENDYLYHAWAEPFHQYGIDAVIEGDSHMHKITYPLRPDDGPGSAQGFIRDDETGTTFMGEGTWGAKTRADDDDKPWTLDSAQITQIKWIHVHPNRIEIRTVLTENAAGVASVSDRSPFAPPQGIELHAAPNYGAVIRIPFSLNSWHEEKLSFQGNLDVPPPDEVLPFKNLGDEKLRMHFFYPRQRTTENPLPVAVLFFGGGWVNGTPAHFFGQARHLAEQGIVAVCPEYRIASIHGTTPYDCVRDAKSAIRWIRTYAGTFGVDPGRIIAVGGSAGGHVAAATALIENFEQNGEDLTVSSKPDALVLFNPVLDTTGKGYGVDKVAPNGVGDPTILSPVHHVRDNLPPTIIFHGTADSTVPFENAQRFTRLMKKAGNDCTLVPYPGQNHGFFNRFSDDRQYYVDTLTRMDDFLRDHGYLPPKS